MLKIDIPFGNDIEQRVRSFSVRARQSNKHWLGCGHERMFSASVIEEQIGA